MTNTNFKPELNLIGQDGNAFNLLGLARRVAIKNKMDWDTIREEATAGDYSHLLAVLSEHFDVT
jgi:hypothetical protein